MCEENTHKHTLRIGEVEEEAIGKQSQWGLISNSVNKCKLVNTCHAVAPIHNKSLKSPTVQCIQ